LYNGATLATTSSSKPSRAPTPPSTAGSAESTGVDGIARLSYNAGDPSTRYTEDFYAKADLPHDVILGMPFLMHSHALTINPRFAHQEPNEDFLLFELRPATEESKKRRAAFAEQKRAEKEASVKQASAANTTA
jgi:hypothetical protein